MEKLAEGYGLVEAPLWSDGRGLLFSDVLFGGVYCLAEDGQVSQVFEHRRGIGGMALHAAGGVIVSGRNISFKPFSGGPTQVLLARDEAAGLVGFNDLTTDAAGRIYAGSLGNSPVFDDGRAPRAGDLYRLDLDGSAHRVAHDIVLTNGLGFSPDGGVLYHADSERDAVFQYDVQDQGDLGEKRLFTETGRGAPDGLAVSEDGRVWVALAGGSSVAAYSPAGVEEEFLPIDEPMCTSVCFGGRDRRDLYVVSGSRGSASERAGAVYRTRLPVAGAPVSEARVPVR